ncbi:MAG: LysM peptidoglycan-binding domain-containing M23 family metallopeptidase [Anaerolineaceae bacterium]
MKNNLFPHFKLFNKQIARFSLILFFLTACTPVSTNVEITPAISETIIAPTISTQSATPIPTRESYLPGTLVDYTVQTGDTLPALAAHFNTTEKEIHEANPTIPADVTTLPPGMPVKIPIYYKALWGNPFHILPDSLFINGPAQIGFNTVEFVNSQPGWLKNYSALSGEETRVGGDLINYVATEFSISPRLLLALAEYQTGALSQPILDSTLEDYPLGYKEQFHKGFYLQLVWAANILNNGYYQWRTGRIDTINRLDGTLEHPDPWQNASTVALQNYFSLVLPIEQYNQAIYVDGFAATYQKLFGNPWVAVQDHIPGSLVQPIFILPFTPGKTWAFTGAPHSGWGSGDPLAALDFAPPTSLGGCAGTSDFTTAIADGEVVRSEPGLIVIDLDKDGDEHTGWNILYLHMSSVDKVRQGTLVKAGDPIGHPSCEGGEATGTHVHIARKYNGEWIPADSALPFIMDGWTPHNGTDAYFGTLSKKGYVIIASDTSSPTSMITAGN